MNPLSPDSYVSYRLLLELCNIFKEKREERVMKKLIDYGVLKSPNEHVKKQIEMAGNYADDFGTAEKIDIALDDTTKKALKELAELLKAEKSLRIFKILFTKWPKETISSLESFSRFYIR